MSEEMSVRSQTVGLPPTKERTLELLKQLLDLSQLQQISITVRDVTVTRVVPDSSDVIPELADSEINIDADFVLGRLALTEPDFDPDAHPLHRIRDVMGVITDQGLRPLWILAPAGGLVEAFFDLPEGTTHAFGMQLLTLSDPEYSKFVVVGSPTNYLVDASLGVVVDMGI